MSSGNFAKLHKPLLQKQGPGVALDSAKPIFDADLIHVYRRSGLQQRSPAAATSARPLGLPPEPWWSRSHASSSWPLPRPSGA